MVCKVSAEERRWLAIIHGQDKQLEPSHHRLLRERVFAANRIPLVDMRSMRSQHKNTGFTAFRGPNTDLRMTTQWI